MQRTFSKINYLLRQFFSGAFHHLPKMTYFMGWTNLFNLERVMLVCVLVLDWRGGVGDTWIQNAGAGQGGGGSAFRRFACKNKTPLYFSATLWWEDPCRSPALAVQGAGDGQFGSSQKDASSCQALSIGGILSPKAPPRPPPQKRVHTETDTSRGCCQATARRRIQQHFHYHLALPPPQGW